MDSLSDTDGAVWLFCALQCILPSEAMVLQILLRLPCPGDQIRRCCPLAIFWMMNLERVRGLER